MELAGQSREVSLPKIISSLPPLPTIVVRALQMVASNEERLRQLHDLICTDPAFAAELLKFANSPLYGIATEVRSTLQAAILMGYERLKGIVLTVGMRSYLGNASNVPALKACWRHSLACAMIAEELAAVSGVDKDVAYTAGIIHDIGRLALISANPRLYEKVSTFKASSAAEYLQKEKEVLGIDHCQAGHVLVTAWRLPLEFLDITSRHHEPPGDGVFDTLAVVKAGCSAAEALGFGFQPVPADRSCTEILSEMPAYDRLQLLPEPAALASRIGSKIICVESI